ncbi:MAG: sulfotransferase [Candidatus Omnitrophica bacterium]|nr:sulfotransferase [Candidatus Omnitrophota bacterium]MBU1922987.1 sulfotransferase [Candidatus Omnitrophota bacterium]
MEPIFIIGTERSGTNLLRVILNSHSNIAIPHPPHIMKNFFKLEPLYFNLSRDINFQRLINDVVKMVELHFYPWEIKIDKDRIFREVKGRNLISIFFSIYDQYLESTKKKRWGCKSTFMIYHVALIRQYYPLAKFIYMVRDGRDVAVSGKKTIFNHYSVYYTALLWKKEQEIGIFWLGKLPKDRILLIKYEDLLSEPDKMARIACSFLDEPYQENMLNYFSTNEAKKSASLSAAWKNTSASIIIDNFGKFKTELKKKEIDLFEAVSGQELDYFSYKLSKDFSLSEGARAKRIKFRFAYLIEELFLMIKVQLQSFFTDKNIFLRLKKFWFLKLIKILRYFQWN